MISRPKLVVLASFLFMPAMALAQVPDATGSCRANCPGSGGHSSKTVSPAIQRQHNQYVATERADQAATNQVISLIRKGRKAQAKNKFQEALDDFQRAETTLLNDHCEAPPGTYLNIGKYNMMAIRKEQNLNAVHLNLASARSDYAAWQQRQRPAAPKPVAQPANATLVKKAPAQVNNNGTAMQQLRAAAGDNRGPSAAGAPAVGSVCVAQGAPGSWGGCVSPDVAAKLAANDKARKKLDSMKTKRDEKQKEYDDVGARLYQTKNDMFAGKGNTADLAKQASKLSNQQVKLHDEIARKNDEMSSFLVKFEESNKPDK